MNQAPWLDTPDVFDPTRIRLADIDGSGVTDMIYLAADGVRIYFNQSGNAWSEEDLVLNYPPVQTLANIQALDLLSNGTACLVWTSSDPGDAGHSMRYIDLMSAQGRVPGRKPKITAEQKKEIVEDASSGRKTPAEIARLLKIHRATVSRIVSQARAGI